MPHVTIHHDEDLFAGDDKRKSTFVIELARAIVDELNAIDPATGKMSELDPLKDLVINGSLKTGFSRSLIRVTVEIVGNDWPDRMSNIDARLESIRARIAPYVDHLDTWEPVLVYFVPISAKCWA
jgi:hypothetical protein